MKILAFETSCDDTTIAIVENGTTVLSSVRTSQPEHDTYGGVVPELAARLHTEHWHETLQSALDESGCTIESVDAIAVTQGPGLQTSLLVGTESASQLALLYQKPIIPVHHIYGHICSSALGRGFLEKDSDEPVRFPALVLTVSGGHTSLYLWEDKTVVKNIGNTLDDACGEAFDKVAKMLGLGYPGGPIVSKLAETGNRTAYDFPRIFLEKDSLDFSFSGLKAAVYRVVERYKQSEKTDQFSEKFVRDVCASFEECVKDTFLKKIDRALERYPEVVQFHFVGGVSANTYLRENFSSFAKASEDSRENLGRKNIPLLVPQKFSYCTDNAAMIGCAAYQLWEKFPRKFSIDHVDPNPRLSLEEFLGRL